MTMQIHAFPHSPRGFKVLAAAAQLGVDYEFRMCDLLAGAQKAPGYTALNPNQKMPTLEDGDLKLWESNAILLYLAEKKPEAGLSPAEPAARADMLRWMFWETSTWDPGCATLAFQRVVKPLFGLGGPDPVEVEKGLEKFHFAARILDAQLKGRRFVCGERLTLADFALAADLTLAEQADLPVAAYADIARWGAAMAELPGWRAAMAMRDTQAAA